MLLSRVVKPLALSLSYLLLFCSVTRENWLVIGDFTYQIRNVSRGYTVRVGKIERSLSRDQSERLASASGEIDLPELCFNVSRVKEYPWVRYRSVACLCLTFHPV